MIVTNTVNNTLYLRTVCVCVFRSILAVFQSLTANRRVKSRLFTAYRFNYFTLSVSKHNTLQLRVEHRVRGKEINMSLFKLIIQLTLRK